VQSTYLHCSVKSVIPVEILELKVVDAVISAIFIVADV
jgi:hypothetical protein